MNILMICTEKLPVPPVLGGAIQTYIAGSLPYLKNAHTITVLGVNDPSLPDEETIDGVRYVRIPGKVFTVYQEGVTQYLETNEFDLIHIFNRPRLVLPVRQAAPNAKITLSMHNDMFSPEKINPEEAALALEEVSNIVTVSDYIGNEISRLFPQAATKVKTIYSGVDTEQFLPGHHPKMRQVRNELRRANGLENKTVLLFAGRLSHNKGVDRLIRALPELSKRFNDLALVIVGSKWFSQNDVTDYVAYIRSLANRLSVPVVTTGFVAPNEIQNWFAAADLFVCTSVWQEPLARVHYEAMAAGLPIVTTARGGNPEVIQLGENGLVVENPEDPNNFTEAISKILSNKALMKRMGEKGRELALTLYQWDRVGSEILDVWNHATLSQSTAPVPAVNKVTSLEKYRTEQRPNKATAKKATAKKSATNKATAEKATAKKSATNKAAAKKAIAKKNTVQTEQRSKQPSKPVERTVANLANSTPTPTNQNQSGTNNRKSSLNKKVLKSFLQEMLIASTKQSLEKLARPSK
ncbi:glycosyl transferase family 1 [Bacillus sp. 7586-K]|nr:glycosyl transferase family 1 [Bacillus sp. 7586-K]